MPRRAELPSTKHHITLYDEDWDFLEANYGRYSANALGASAVVRAIVHQKVRELRERAAAAADRRLARRDEALEEETTA